jgi:signal transduction histidine kinase
MSRQAKSQDFIEKYRSFIHQLAQCQEWDELTQFVTAFPRMFLPVNYVSLHIYDYRNAQLQFVTNWSQTGTVPPANPHFPSQICQNCLLIKPPGLRPAISCPAAPGATACKLDGESFGLPLLCRNVLVGILYFRCQPGWRPTADQTKLINLAAPELALALVLLLAYPRRMAQVRIAAQLQERRHSAHVLHNSLAQHIGYLLLNLNRLASEDPRLTLGHVQNDLAHMREVADDAYNQLRHTLILLHSPEQVDLPHAIKDYAQAVARHVNLQIEVATQGAPIPLSPQAGQHIFLLVQEGLNNIEKHARARRVQITLCYTADNLSLSIEDDGDGFVPAVAPRVGHFGLAMMQECVEALGGDMMLQSAPGQGTQLKFKIPLHRLQLRLEPEGAFAYPTTSA